MYDLYRHVIEFFLASLNNDWDDFDFEPFFEEFKGHLYSKLLQHALVDDFMEFYHYWNDLYCHAGDLSPFYLQTAYIRIDEEDVRMAICQLHYDRCKATFEDMFCDLIELNEKLEQDRSELELKHLIALFDECIHAQHQNGFILEDYFTDPDDLRSEAEQEWKEEQEEIERLKPNKSKIKNLRDTGLLI